MNEVSMLIREGKIEQAEQHLNRMRGTAGDSAEYHYQRSLLLIATGQRDEALRALETASELDAQNAHIQFRLAYVSDLHGNDERALLLYEALATRTPAHVNALLNLATFYEDRGKYDQALACVNRVLGVQPTHRRATLFRRDIESAMNMFYDEHQEITRQKRSALMDTPLTDFELSVRSRNCLKKMNINTLGDLLRVSEPELLAYKNFGETSLSEIKAMLTAKGLRLGLLKDEAPPPPAYAQRTSGRPATQGTPEILNRPLSEIEFSGRSRKCLQRLNLVTLGDLVQKTEAELLSTKNFGQTSLNEVKQRLQDFALNLRKVT